MRDSVVTHLCVLESVGAWKGLVSVVPVPVLLSALAIPYPHPASGSFHLPAQPASVEGRERVEPSWLLLGSQVPRDSQTRLPSTEAPSHVSKLHGFRETYLSKAGNKEEFQRLAVLAPSLFVHFAFWCS